MNKVILGLTALIFLAIWGCSSPKEVMDCYKPITIAQFLEEPFGKSENVVDLKKQFASDVKLKKLIRRNIHDPQKIDTIFQFYHRKSEVFVYKTYFNREMLLGGVIYDNRFPLINGITPGMSRDSFFKSFIDLKPEVSDSIKIESKEAMRKFSFIFDSKGKIKKISFTMYVD